MKIDIVRMHTLVSLYAQESLILSTRVSAAGILRENSLLSHEGGAELPWQEYYIKYESYYYHDTRLLTPRNYYCTNA